MIVARGLAANQLSGGEKIVLYIVYFAYSLLLLLLSLLAVVLLVALVFTLLCS